MATITIVMHLAPTPRLAGIVAGGDRATHHANIDGACTRVTAPSNVRSNATSSLTMTPTVTKTSSVPNRPCRSPRCNCTVPLCSAK